MNNSDLISRIINLRESRDWTQAELGRRMGLEKSVMNKIESGTRKVTTEELQKLSEIFEVTTDYLLGRNQTPTWANKEDIVQLDKILQSNAGMAYGDEEASPEDREIINDLIAGYFWSKKQKEKKKE